MYRSSSSMASSIYPQLWAGVALITLYSTVLYTAIAGVESRNENFAAAS